MVDCNQRERVGGHLPARVRVSRALPLLIALAAGPVFGQETKPAPKVDRAAAKAGYPTSDRVEFVLECMKNNGGEYAYVYKCSCAIDEIAKRLTYEQFVDGGSSARYQGMGGERTGVFRDAPGAKDMAKRYREAVSTARKTCDVPR